MTNDRRVFVTDDGGVFWTGDRGEVSVGVIFQSSSVKLEGSFCRGSVLRLGTKGQIAREKSHITF